jgi:type VI secretion system protein ImpL
MWVWILSALVVSLSWMAWYFLRGATPNAVDTIPLWVPIVVTGAAFLTLVGLFVYRRVRAARAARALEKAIAQQAQEQALKKPERTAEIQELSRQLQQGIASLKASKLGGGMRGESALYVLPWYVMVGPPGAGKTTALRHSGLVFPFLDPKGGGVRGVGGTRNCDWWFTNEAILLDTAGRYTTEADDHDEWMAFLEQLLKYRSDKPLNGVIVTVSVTELIDATDEQIQQTARKVRARIDEMQSVLKMILPVYVLFTKADMVAGFSEFFGELKKSDRAEPWGATLRLNADKREPGKLFDAEFDTLVERLHHRAMNRLATERKRETKERVYQFPLEFASIKRNLSDFMAQAFSPAPLPTGSAAASAIPDPILRGFYFTSGVQEGRPLERVVAAMGRAFGLRGDAIEEDEEKAESKSFFLHDVFTAVIFPDQRIAGRTEAELRRVRLQRALAAVAAALVALLLLVPSCISHGKNKALINETLAVSKGAAGVNWQQDEEPPQEKVDKLQGLRLQTEKLDDLRNDPPIDMTFLMFQGDKLYPAALEQYRATLHKGFVDPSRGQLEERVKKVSGTKYLEDFNTLKTYLLLGDAYRKHLNEPGVADWETGRLTQVWADHLRRTHQDIPEPDLKAKLAPHVAYYVKKLAAGEIPGEPLDTAQIERARDILRHVGPHPEYYDRFVNSLIDQKFDESKGDDRDNLKYPPITLEWIFRDRPEVLTKVRCTPKADAPNWCKVMGPYTQKGHDQVLASLEDGINVLEREQWVVPLSLEEKQSGSKIKTELERVRDDYDNQYVNQWKNFFRHIDVAIPDSNQQAIDEYKALSTPDWPYQRLLRTLADNTMFDELEEPTEAEQTIAGDGGVISQIKDKIDRRVNSKTGTFRLGGLLKSGRPGEPRDPVPEAFRSMVRFGVPAPQPKPKEGEPPRAPTPVELGNYVGKLQSLSGEMINIEDGPPDADTKKATGLFEEAVSATEAQLLKMDETGQKLMDPLLMNPLRQGYKAVVRHAGGSASGLWDVMVYPAYRDKIKDRYPFNLASSRDASLSDAIAFFKPKDGQLWSFYDQYLKPFHMKQGHEYIPLAHLEHGRKGKPFTPFNPNLYNCLRRADEISDALFAEAEGKPKIEFEINVKTVSPIVSDVIFEVDGQRKVYRNEKEFWQGFTWPGAKSTGARVQVRGAGGLDEEITREGPWGIFRLFEAGTTTALAGKDDVFVVTWQMTAPPVTVTVEVRPSRGNHPFPSSFFRATNCPESIGDRFGKGKG